MRFRAAAFLLAFLALSGCSLTTEEKSAREKSLKKTTGLFTSAVIAGDFRAAYGYTTGRLGNPAAFEKHLRIPWDPQSTLTKGTVSSMSWVGDDAAKVKIVWTFLQGVQQSYSAETSIWIWKNGKWHYEGRGLR